MDIFIFPFITAAAITLLSVPLIIRLARRYGLVDDPKKRYHPANTHSGIIPRAGGAAIAAGIIGAGLWYLSPSPQVYGIYIGAVLVVAVGLWDDVVDLSPYLRLLLNFLAAGIVVWSGVMTPFITNPFGGVFHLDQFSFTVSLLGSEYQFFLFSILFSLLWIVWMMNAVGWSAGVDGQFPGFVAIASIVIAILSQRLAASDVSQTLVTELSMITAGAFVGFLYWNFYPQKIMPGYGGKSLAGFMLAILSILSGAKVGTALLVLGVPLIDAFYTILRRILKGQSPFRADRGHLHHLLLDLGWGKRRIAFFYWGITAFLGVIALTLQSPQKLFVFLFLFVVIGAVLATVRLFDFFRVVS